MKLSWLPLFVFAVISIRVMAADPSEQFLSAYQAYEQGEKLERSGGSQDALAKYRFAESLLVSIARDNPGWQKPVVDYRLKKTREALGRVQGNGAASPDGTVVDQAPLSIPSESPASPSFSEGPRAVAERGPSITIVPPGAVSSSRNSSGSTPGGSTEVRSLRKRIADLTDQLRQANDVLSAQKTRSSDLEGARWAEERAKLQGDLNAANARIGDLQRDLRAKASWEKDFKDLQKRLDDAVADRTVAEEQYRTEFEKTSRNRDQLLKDLGAAREEARMHAEQKAVMEKRAAETATALADADARRQELALLREKVSRMEIAGQSLRENLESEKKRASETARRESLLQAKGEAAENDRKRLSSRLQELSKTISGMVGEHPGPEALAMGSEVDSLRIQLRDAEAAAAAMLTQARGQESALRDLESRGSAIRRDLSADKAALEEEIERLAGKKRSFAMAEGASPSGVEGGMAAAEAEISRRLDDVTKEEKGLDQRLADQIREFERAKGELTAKSSEGMRRIDELEAKCTELRSRLSDNLEKLTALLAGNAPALRKEMADLRALLQDNSRLAEESRKRMSQLRSESASLAVQLKARTAELSASREEVLRVKEALKVSDSSLSELKERQAKDAEHSRQIEADLKRFKEGAEEPVREREARLKDLQAQLESRDAEIARLRKKGGVSAELSQSQEENRLLRGIVERQMQEQGRREGARHLVEEEIAKLNVRSDILTTQLGILSAPVVKLTPEEQALFKTPIPATTPEPEQSSPQATKIQASIAAPIRKENPAAMTTNAPSAPIPGSSPLAPASTMSNPPVTNEAPTLPSASGSGGNSAGTPEATPVSDIRTNGSASSSEMPWIGKFKEYLAKAKGQFDAQRFGEAEQTFQEALKLSPDDYFALSNLGVVEFQLGKLREAEVVLNKATQHSNENSFALTTLGIVHYRQNRLEDAAKVLTRAVGVNDQDYTAHNYLGIVLAAMGKGKAGESEIMRAIEINPKYADAQFNLAVIYATGKPPAKMMAKRHYAKAIELGSPPDPSLERLMQ